MGICTLRKSDNFIGPDINGRWRYFEHSRLAALLLTPHDALREQFR